MAHPNEGGKPIFNMGGPTRSALVATNVRYAYNGVGDVSYPQCRVRTREGHASAFAITSAVRSMFNYVATDPILHTPVNRVIFYDGSNVKNYDVPTNTINTFSPPITGIATGLKASVAEAGTRAYLAIFDNKGIGVSQGYVVDSSNNADKLFQGPPGPAITIAAADAVAAGTVTAGSHNFAVVIVTRTGYTTIPGPQTAFGVFNPTTAVAAGGKKMDVLVTGTPWPTATASIALLMTTTTNPAKYFFVPGAVAGVPGGLPFAFNFTVDIDDAALLQCVPADALFDQFSQDVNGAGPFNPSFVCAYGRRMVYGAGDRVYISDPDDFQAISADQHVLFLPGLRNIKTAFPFRDNNLYLLGDYWTYSTSDDGNVPTSWSGPHVVDGNLGTIAVLGITVDPSQSYALVATQSGFRIFQDGAYQDPSLSFWQPDWATINWAAAPTIELINDIEEQCFRALAPLGGATSPSNELVWNYMSGKTPETVRYSKNVVSDRYCFTLVQNNTSGRREVWMGPGTASGGGAVWRKDDTLTQDVGVDIAGQVWESQYLLDIEELGGPVAFHGLHFTAKGTGTAFTITGFGPDHVKSAGAKVNNLATMATGGIRILRQWSMNAENQSIEFKTDTGWFELIEFEPYYTPWIRQR